MSDNNPRPTAPALLNVTCGPTTNSDSIHCGVHLTSLLTHAHCRGRAESKGIAMGLFQVSSTEQLLYQSRNREIRQLTLYSTDDGSRQGFSLHVGGKKIKNKIYWLAGVGGKKNKKGKIDSFPIKMAIFRVKKDNSDEVNPACRKKK